jgi:hypothetical protein
MQRTQERLTEELIVLNTHLQHQKEEIAFFKDLTEQSNKRKEALLSRFLAVFPSLVGAIEKTLPLIGPESPPDMIALADLYSAQREQIRLLNQDLRDNLITLECLPANLL